ncbi:MAG: hypothetical protein JW751_14500 [Polyangiaceae bacterium]|nr:hypothetical protein [Polyangiaceae bacterium]
MRQRRRSISVARGVALGLVAAACRSGGEDVSTPGGERPSGCADGLAPCGGDCVDLATNATHCGDCGQGCATGAFCEAGSCGCQGDLTRCGADCVDTESDAAHCGACDVACAPPAVCSRSDCSDAGCAEQTECDGSCVDLATDPRHCGACGQACSGGSRCEDGACVCLPGQTGCGVTGSCPEVAFTVSDTLSTVIPTVDTVHWSVNVPIEAAHIDFGRRADDWEYQATIGAPSQSDNRTMLLGMKPSTEYFYRIAVEQDGRTCTSEVRQIVTGEKRNGLPVLETTTPIPDGVSQGFTLACVFGFGFGGSGTWSFILDQDGEFVWWYRGSGGEDCVRATMSYDGESMWLANGNVPGPDQGTLTRVRMDGTDEIGYFVPHRHHDVAVLPDEYVAYFEYEDGDAEGCDVVKELNPATGVSTTVYDVGRANPSFSGHCHANAINWWPEQHQYTLSVMYWDSIIAFTRQGVLAWRFGGEISDYAGPSWSRQHQHHLLGDRILLFSNDGESGTAAAALEYELEDRSARRVWSYTNSENSTQSMGDVRRLSNGNTLITYSNQGVILEVNHAKDLVREIRTSGATGLGYVVRRRTLYGPPPPYAE